MKYLHLGLVFLSASSHAVEQTQDCLPNTELNPSNRFHQEVIDTDTGDFKVVNDKATGLQWAYCFVGQTLSADQSSCEGQPIVPYDLEGGNYPNNRKAAMEALALENERLDYSDKSWRLPNIKELMSIYNEQCTPAYYPNFSYTVNQTASEIDDLVHTKIPWGGVEDEVAEARARSEKGKAYQRHSVTSDTAFIDNKKELSYTVVRFGGFDTPTKTTALILKPSGMLRLVREIPQQ
ncbi:DUF1566 domain-containing protein [uncultured Vibrio sp.]|uniref:Lcl domain-containing protein n=1 Tax=uncultured Vibrio sp. TaxID=114054 RepID=UPI0029C62235|nr:DUF1566 domain-containing protein [uncultured Vibrio sp.]